MQNKLNEILELCIEKSKGDLFYQFAYSPKGGVLMVTKFVKDDLDTLHCKRNIDFILEYMQNE